MSASSWFAVRQELNPQRKKIIGIASFLLPLLLWSLVSYVPFIWHPKVLIKDVGEVGYFQKDMLIEKSAFQSELDKMETAGKALPVGKPANPIYLPAPHEVAKALYTGFVTPPAQRDGLWLHESLWQSIQVIFWGFFISSLFGVPLAILCGTYSAISRLFEPFIEFFRYLPAPALER